ncbi:unnamed protein product [Closterium sp. Naga37s-1]|nr:unnamed protein product [Closterium sp. Naga37s-1]
MRGNEGLRVSSEGDAEGQVGGATVEECEWGDLEEFADVECANWQDISAVCQAKDAEGIKLLFIDIQVADVTAGLPDVTHEDTQKQAGRALQQERPSRSQIQVSYHITFPDHSLPISDPPASTTEASLSSAEAVTCLSSGDTCNSSSCSGGKVAAHNVHTPPAAAAAAAASTNADPTTAAAAVSPPVASTVPAAPPNHAVPPSSTAPSFTAPNTTLPRPLLPVKIAHLRNRHPHIDSSPGECVEYIGLSPATPGKMLRAYQRREKGDFEAYGATSPALAAVALAAPTLAGPPSPLLAASVFSSGSPRASSPSKVRASGSGSGSGGPVLAPSRFREGPRRAELDFPMAESPSARAVVGKGLLGTNHTTLEVMTDSKRPVVVFGDDLDDPKGVAILRGERVREGATKVSPSSRWKRLVKAVMHRQTVPS